MAITKNPFFKYTGPAGPGMTDEEKRMAEIEKLVAEQIERQRRGEVGRQTFARLPGQTIDPNVVPERFNITQDIVGNYWNRIQRTAGGPLIIERLRNEYTPADQRKIEKLYQVRSQVATDPELTEDERQNAFDRVDAEISRVPHIPPIMREPTPQQKFDASMVTAPDGTKGYVDKSGNFKPFEASKLAQEEEKEYRTYYGKQLAEMTKENEKESQSPSVIADRARWMADLAFGRVRETPPNPELDLLWQGTMTRLDASQWGRADKKQTFAAMQEYIRLAMERKGLSEAEAKYDFMNRWAQASGGGQFCDLLPKMSGDEQRKHRYIGATTALENDPVLGDFDETFNLTGLRRGEGRVTVEPDLPPELEAIFPNLDNEDKRAIRQKLDEGWTVTEVLTAIGKAG